MHSRCHFYNQINGMNWSKSKLALACGQSNHAQKYQKTNKITHTNTHKNPEWSSVFAHWKCKRDQNQTFNQFGSEKQTRLLFGFYG